MYWCLKFLTWMTFVCATWIHKGEGLVMILFKFVSCYGMSFSYFPLKWHIWFFLEFTTVGYQGQKNSDAEYLLSSYDIFCNLLCIAITASNQTKCYNMTLHWKWRQVCKAGQRSSYTELCKLYWYILEWNAEYADTSMALSYVYCIILYWRSLDIFYYIWISCI